MRERVRMRVLLSAGGAGPAAGIRPFTPTDVVPLGALMLRAYRGGVDDEGETEDDAIEEVRRTVAGAYGRFVPECSMVREHDGQPIAAVLVTRHEGRPFVAFTFTDPRFVNRGHAAACFQAAMRELFARGERELRLDVTAANEPAMHLYRKLGFEVEE